MSNAEFWQHYFYKMHQFDLDEARRAALIRRSADHHHQAGESKELMEMKTSWGDSGED